MAECSTDGGRSGSGAGRVGVSYNRGGANCTDRTRGDSLWRDRRRLGRSSTPTLRVRRYTRVIAGPEWFSPFPFLLRGGARQSGAPPAGGNIGSDEWSNGCGAKCRYFSSGGFGSSWRWCVWSKSRRRWASFQAAGGFAPGGRLAARSAGATVHPHARGVNEGSLAGTYLSYFISRK